MDCSEQTGAIGTQTLCGDAVAARTSRLFSGAASRRLANIIIAYLSGDGSRIFALRRSAAALVAFYLYARANAFSNIFVLRPRSLVAGSSWYAFCVALGDASARFARHHSFWNVYRTDAPFARIFMR